MRSIKNFFHDINDILLALIIVVLAVGIIMWRMQFILAYPAKLVNGEVNQVEEQLDEAEGVDSEAEAEPRG